MRAFRVMNSRGKRKKKADPRERRSFEPGFSGASLRRLLHHDIRGGCDRLASSPFPRLVFPIWDGGEQSRWVPSHFLCSDWMRLDGVSEKRDRVGTAIIDFSLPLAS